MTTEWFRLDCTFTKVALTQWDERHVQINERQFRQIDRPVTNQGLTNHQPGDSNSRKCQILSISTRKKPDDLLH